MGNDPKQVRPVRILGDYEAAGGPKLFAEGEDLKKKSGRANRRDLHTNVFNYLVRRWACAHCGGEVKSPTQVSTYEMPPE